MTRTPGPWAHGTGAGIVAPDLRETLSSGRVVRRRVATALGTSIDEMKGNQEFILRACNAHDALVEVLSDLVKDPVSPHVRKRARDLLAEMAPL